MIYDNKNIDLKVFNRKTWTIHTEAPNTVWHSNKRVILEGFSHYLSNKRLIKDPITSKCTVFTTHILFDLRKSPYTCNSPGQ